MPHVFAYLDPGSGLLLFQAAIAGIVALPIVFRRQVARGWRAIRRGAPRGAKPSTPSDHAES